MTCNKSTPLSCQTEKTVLKLTLVDNFLPRSNLLIGVHSRSVGPAGSLGRDECSFGNEKGPGRVCPLAVILYGDVCAVRSRIRIRIRARYRGEAAGNGLEANATSSLLCLSSRLLTMMDPIVVGARASERCHGDALLELNVADLQRREQRALVDGSHDVLLTVSEER